MRPLTKNLSRWKHNFPLVTVVFFGVFYFALWLCIEPQLVYHYFEVTRKSPFFKSAFNKTDSQLTQVQNGIYANFDHVKTGSFRVSVSDLNIFCSYLNKTEGFVPTCENEVEVDFWTN